MSTRATVNALQDTLTLLYQAQDNLRVIEQESLKSFYVEKARDLLDSSTLTLEKLATQLEDEPQELTEDDIVDDCAAVETDEFHIYEDEHGSDYSLDDTDQDY